MGRLGRVSDVWALRIVKVCLGAAVTLWISVPVAVQLLTLLFLFDIGSCLMTHRSSVQRTIRRAAVTSILCGAVYTTWFMAKNITGLALGWDVGSVVGGYYIIGELIEITLNCGTVIGIPPKFVKWLETAQSMTGQQQQIKDQQTEIDQLKRNASDSHGL